MRTHYDNLKVARNAPLEVIRAAYTSLSKKYHPDNNPSSDAERIIRIINEAYNVLSDPEKRREHDAWIEKQERQESTEQQYEYIAPEEKVSPKVINETTQKPPFDPIDHLTTYWFLYLILFAVGYGIFGSDKPLTKPAPGPKPYTSQPPLPTIPEKPAYVRPMKAPNGAPWPSTAAYISGYEKLLTAGHSKVTVDNTNNNSDMLVKLVSLDGPKAFPVRVFFIPGQSKFTVKKVKAGTYDIRTRNLDTGRLLRSESFTLEETRNDEGVRYSNMRLTLYKVRDGNMQSYDLAEEEF